METSDACHFTPANYWPTNLVLAADAAKEINISEERLLDLANSKIAPHYRLDGGGPLFKVSELKKWAGENILHKYEGKELPINLRLVVPFPEAKDPPEELSKMDGLKEVLDFERPSGVYFLINDGRVVYVGQTREIMLRLYTHRKQKDFDKVYMIEVPNQELDTVERKLIKVLDPPLNKVHKPKKED